MIVGIYKNINCKKADIVPEKDKLVDRRVMLPDRNEVRG